MSETIQFLTLTEAAARLGAGGHKPSVCTLWRWCRKGCKGVTLSYSRFGREIRVTAEALAEFGRAMAAADRVLDPPTSPATVQTPGRSAARRAREIAEAKGRLLAAGIAVGHE